jgi:hypothetical protein
MDLEEQFTQHRLTGVINRANKAMLECNNEIFHKLSRAMFLIGFLKLTLINLGMSEETIEEKIKEAEKRFQL